MDDMKNWAFSVCCAAISGGIISMIIPKENSLKIFKYVFYIFFLSVIISPLYEIEFSGINEKLYFSNEKYVGVQEYDDFSDNSKKFIESAIVLDTQKQLSEFGYEAKDISVSVNIYENGSIDISKFAVTFEDIVNTNNIKKIIFEKTGLEPEIILTGE